MKNHQYSVSHQTKEICYRRLGMCSALMMPAEMVPRRNCIHFGGGGLSDKKETSAAIQKPQPSTVWRKCAADPEKFKQYIIVCVDLPCGQTYIWFVFLAMAIDHSNAWPSSNETETVRGSGTPYEVAFLYTNFDLQKGQELLRGDDGYPRRGACVIYTFVCLPAPSCG